MAGARVFPDSQIHACIDMRKCLGCESMRGLNVTLDLRNVNTEFLN